MGKLRVFYDPPFNIKNSKAVVNARELPSSKRTKRQNLNKKRWLPQQQQEYISFVVNNLYMFQDCAKFKTYSLMSKQIKTRNYLQCKTHHIKMILKFNNSMKDMISHYIPYEEKSHSQAKKEQLEIFSMQKNEQSQDQDESLLIMQRQFEYKKDQTVVEQRSSGSNVFDVLSL